MDIHVSSMFKIFMIMKKSKSARTSYWPDRICEKMHLKHFAGQWQGTLTLRPNQARLTDDTTPDFRVCRLGMGVYFDPLNQTRLFGNINTRIHTHTAGVYQITLAISSIKRTLYQKKSNSRLITNPSGSLCITGRPVLIQTDINVTHCICEIYSLCRMF